MKFVRIEVASIVHDDVVWYAEMTRNAVEEFDSCRSCLVGDWYSLYPFGEFIDCDQ